MKSVLLIDGSEVFYNLLEDKFSSENIELKTASNREAYTRIITLLPDLIIIELQAEPDYEIISLLEKKHTDPNAKNIPVILCGPVIDRTKIMSLAEYKVIKYFSKPIKFDIFFDTVGRVLHSLFMMDSSPCILDLHVNSNIIFVELAMGLNREKLLMLKYRLQEIISKYRISNPKAVLMLTDIQLSFVDGANLELLMENLTADHRIANKNIKILSLEPFIAQFIEGHKEYAGIEVANNLQSVMNSLLNQSSVYDTKEFAVDRILSMDKKFEQDSSSFLDSRSSVNSKENLDGMMKIGVIDDDIIIRKILENSFSSINATTKLYANGNEFLKAVNEKESFDIVILDLFLPDIDGIAILQNLQRKGFTTPIIIYSKAAAREVVVKALSLGARSYMVKPQKPPVIVNKILEILHTAN